MIAELFYPKELKDIIADLRAKDDLNEEALKRLNNIPFVVFIFWLLVIAFYFLLLSHRTILLLHFVFLL